MSKFIETELRDGVMLGVIPTDRAKTDNLVISLLIPISRDVTKYALLARVLNRGTQSYHSLLEISRKTRELYNASVSAGLSRIGETLMLTFSLSSLKQKYAYDDVDIFGGALELVSEMIFKPYLIDGRLGEEYIASEKRLLADALEAQINDKMRYASIRGVQIMCEGEPYAISSDGCIEDIDAITADDLMDCLDFIRKNSRVVMLYAGELPEEYIKQRLSELPFEARNAEIMPATPKKKRDTVNIVTESMEVSQAKLFMGFKTNITLRNGNFVKMALFNEVFGGGSTSKLFMNVREGLSLCYFCSSAADAHKDVMSVICGIEADDFEKTRDAILSELEAVKNGDITEEELMSAKLSLANRYKEMTDSPAYLCLWYLSRIMENRSDSPLDAAHEVMNVTVCDIADAAKGITLDTVYLLKGADE